MRKTVLIIGLLLLTATVYAQQNNSRLSKKEQRKAQKYQLLRHEENGDFIYDHEFDGGGRLNTDGWNAYLEYGRRKNEVTTTIFQFEVGEHKNPKEDKQAVVQGVSYLFGPLTGTPYIYGKQNIFYQVKLGYGQRRIIGGKGNKNGVEVSAIYLGGISLGLLRPYYLQLGNDANTTTFEKFSEENRGRFLNPNNIYGGSGLRRGWDEAEMVPGLHARLGLRYDWAEFNDFVSAIEVGINGEMYTKKVNIMVPAFKGDDPGKQFFFNAYVSLLFGKRW